MNSDLATLVLRAWVASPHSTIQRLDHRSLDVAWDTITSHLTSVPRRRAVPQPICLQGARALDDIQVLVIIPRHLTTATRDLQAAVQQHVLDVLAQQIMPSDTPSSSNMG
jgi:hypothetical protein